MEEAAPPGSSGLLQLARRGDRNHTRGSHRNSRLAVGTRGQKLKGILLMHLLMGCVSSVLICVVWFIHMRNPTEPRRDPSGIPLADRGCCRSHRSTDGAPRRFSQRSEWTRIRHFQHQ